MRFLGAKEPLTEEQLDAYEHRLGLTFPPPLRKHYLRTNGGSPEPYMYEDENVDTVVNDCLPLLPAGESAVSVYNDHVLAKGFVPRHFFPFAVDPGGDYFYVDTSSADGTVYLYRHDTAFEHLIPLNVGLDEFWSRLKPDPYLKPKE